MTTLLVAIGSFFGFIIAYHTYGRWLARKIFGLDKDALVPSQQLRDDVDFVPTRKEVIFGHHFTSIAGTGPIVGPAIAVFWGWLPALIWVMVGSIFIGAVHDFGALVVSLRNRGQTIGEVAGRIIAPRTKILFLLILFFALSIVLAIFGLVIATIFAIYPESVLPVWISMPIAIVIGVRVYKYGGGLLVPSIIALLLIYVSVYIGAYYLPIDITQWGISNPVIFWTILLLIYCFIASVMPVWVLLQPRDFINSHQLIVALILLASGLVIASLTGQAQLSSAPAIAKDIPADAPPIWPFLFITIACGAVSGFHCLVSSGTTSKQVANEVDAQYVGYGGMLLEGALAVVVILACCAGVGMGQLERTASGDYVYKPEAATGADSATEGDAAATGSSEAGIVHGREAWLAYYPATRMVNGESKGGWSTQGLDKKVGAFIDGGANFLTSVGIPLKLAASLIAVLVACFAATTLDTATRLQRYVIQELAGTVRFKPVMNMYGATAIAVCVGGAIAMMPGGEGKPAGTGGLILWPMFGATNQLLAGLAFLVTVFYLWRRNKPILFAVIPMIIMIIMPAWALLWQMFNPDSGWWPTQQYMLMAFGVTIMGLQLWMVVEAIIIWPKAKGVLEEALPPLPKDAKPAVAETGGRSC